ncbi:NADH-quinone oxidoreductase subunit J [Flavisolibacter nicotianae]|uniref:NADH-quinone oxidoreductase subunit J n=1 Tax=Flavisolibacter nicotianae TaxID=2364882 RepID=UPI000EB5722E|nr:NADH-quinone oxidoreductase subunit J [Flavisolibacter nicotianae]
MPVLFYIASVVAIISTLMVITRYQPIHALLYLVVSFLAMAMIFLSLGAPFVAILEIILYAGAIIVLLIFVVMMLNLGKDTALQERQWLQPKTWVGPSILCLVLLTELVILLFRSPEVPMQVKPVPMRAVSIALYKEYVIAVELAGFLLMAGIVGAAHISKHRKKHLHRFLQEEAKGPQRRAEKLTMIREKESTEAVLPAEKKPVKKT